MNKLREYFSRDSRERIQDLLRRHSMTQAQLAEKLEISESSLNRYISGQTDKLSAENVVKMAHIFGVSTDFLLCETDIPYRTNYDIEELGLTAQAAARLYTGEVDPAVVSQLIEHKDFAILVTQIAQYKDATISAGIAGMNAMFSKMNALAMRVSRQQPAVRRMAIQAAQDALALKQPITKPETTAMEATFLRIVADLRKGAEAYITESAKLTTETIDKVIGNLEKRGGRVKAHGVTPEQMVESILDTTEPNVITPEHRAALRTVLMPLFKRPEK